MSRESETPKLISNIEVLSLLQKRLEERTTQNKRLRHRNWIEDKVVGYLKSTPCVRLDSSRREELQTTLQSSKKAAGTTVKTTGFALTEAESIQVVNSMPTEPVEIHLMIDELHSRMTERQQDELLILVGSYIKEEQPNDVKSLHVTETNGHHHKSGSKTRQKKSERENGVKEESS